MKNLLDINPELKVVNKKEILYVAKKHWISFVIPISMMIIGIVGVLPVFFGIGILRIIGFGLLYILFKGLTILLKNISTKVYVTEDHITISQGFLTNTINDISLKKLEGIYLGQGIFGRMLNYGTLFVSTGEVAQQYTIKNPIELRKYIINQNK